MKKVGGWFLFLMMVGFFLTIQKQGSAIMYLMMMVPYLLTMVAATGFSETYEVNQRLTGVGLILLLLGIIMQSIGAGSEASLNAGIKNSILMGAALIATIIWIIICNTCEKMFYSKRWIPIIGIVTVGIYLLLFLKGSTQGGVNAWITIGGVSLQLTECMKFIFVFYNTLVFVVIRDYDERKRMVLGCGYMGLNLIGMLLIGEMGTALILGCVFLVYCFFYMSDKQLMVRLGLITGAFAAVGGGVLWICRKLGNEGTTRIGIVAARINSRIDNWLHPELDAYGGGYQLLRAKAAISVGGLLGSDTHIDVPVADSDFAFVNLICNLGILVALLVIVMLMIIMIEGIRAYLYAGNRFEQGLCVGSVFCIVFSSLIMIFGSTGFLPMTGVPILFLSKGGTTQLVSFLMIGSILNSTSAVKLEEKRRIEGYVRQDFIRKDQGGDRGNDSGNHGIFGIFDRARRSHTGA